MLEIGAVVVKAGEGVCRIDSVITMDVPNKGKDVPYFLLIPVADPKVRVYLPADGEHPEIRPVMTSEEAEELIDRIPSVLPLEIPTEKMREQIYRDEVRSCDPLRVAAVIRTLYRRGEERSANGKRSTALDDRYLTLAEKALYSEIVYATGKTEAEIREVLKSKA